MKEHFTIKNDKVYYKKTVLKNISSDSFEVFYELSGFYISYFDRAFLKDNKGIWWFHAGKSKPTVKFVTSDSANFLVLNEDYAKDNQQVYWMRKQCLAIPNSDAQSFQIMTDTPYFSKDKNQVYALSGSGEGLQIFEDADPETFVGLGWNAYTTDKNNVYHFNWHFMKYNNRAKFAYFLDDSMVRSNKEWQEILESNKKYVKTLHPNIKGWWQDDYDKLNGLEKSDEGHRVIKNNIYYVEKDKYLDCFIPNFVVGAEIESFKSLDHWYGKDTGNVYFKWYKVIDADAGSFEALSNKLAKDKKSYFFNGFKIEDVDYDSFKIINDEKYCFIASDKNNIYAKANKRLGKFKGYADLLSPIKNSDPQSLVRFSEGWAKDKNQVYWNMEPNLKIDVDSFEYLFSKSVNDWAKDKYHLYNTNGRRKVKGIDGATFKVHNEFWGSDKQHAFSFVTERILPSIDVASFNVIDDKGSAEDKNFFYTYKDGHILKKTKKP